MKKSLITTAFAVAAILAAGTLTSCNNDEGSNNSQASTSTSTSTSTKPSTSTSTKPSTSTSTSVVKATVTSIAITKQPNKLTYVEGEVFDKTGMEVTATYSDNTTQVITNYNVDKTEALKLTDTTITIAYQGKTATVTITVEKRIDITVNELKTYRMEAENLDFSKATLREDFAAAGRTFIETPTVGEASGGKSICGYKPGSVFEISLKLLE